MTRCKMWTSYHLIHWLSRSLTLVCITIRPKILKTRGKFRDLMGHFRGCHQVNKNRQKVFDTWRNFKEDISTYSVNTLPTDDLAYYPCICTLSDDQLGSGIYTGQTHPSVEYSWRWGGKHSVCLYKTTDMLFYEGVALKYNHTRIYIQIM